MGLIRFAMIFAILGTMFLGIAANAQVNATLPQFKSGASVMMGVPVDFNILNQRVGAIYEVVEGDDSHVVWKFTGTTGDWAFVFADGRIIVASTVEFDLAARDTLGDELNMVMDMLNSVGGGISEDGQTQALDSAIFYSNESDTYHRIKYWWNNRFDLQLVVPICTISKARMVNINDGQEACDWNYYIDGADLTEFKRSGAIEITEKIPSGVHSISSDIPGCNFYKGHSFIIDAITTPTTRKFVLHSNDFRIWVNETTQSLDLQALQNTIYNSLR
jgi:hypothetical protein